MKPMQTEAIKAVNAAVRGGLLPRLAGNNIRCVDCRKPAAVYDHRDYSKPLDVQPVCHRCNQKRGRAIWSAA